MAIDNREQAARWLKNYKSVRASGLSPVSAPDLLDFAASVLERYVDEGEPKKKKGKKK